MNEYKKIPAEVIEAICLRMIGLPVGKRLYDKVADTVKKYPGYFPWEAKYNSIPEEVHEAYQQEKYLSKLLTDKNEVESKGLWDKHYKKYDLSYRR